MSDTQNNYGVQIEKLEWMIRKLSKEAEHLSQIAAHCLGESTVLRVKVAALEAEVERLKNQVSLAAYGLVTEPVQLPHDHTWKQNGRRWWRG